MSAAPLSIADAQRVVAEASEPLGDEAVPVEQALGRALAEDVLAAGDVPPFPNSAMDGFAVRHGPPGRRLRLAGESRAGRPAERALGEGEAIRISTGAMLPAGATTVVPIEQAAEPEDGWVVVEGGTTPGDHVRGAGEDMRRGDLALTRGSRLGPAELGIAVTAGRHELRCAVAPRVAIVVTGDELRAPGEPLGPGEIHNANAVTLAALAARAGATVSVVAAAPDEPAATEAALRAGLAQADALVVSGGVSVGPHDHVKPALAALGVQEGFWRVSLRPGGPTWFGVRETTLVFGLPGNPVSAMVTFLLFAAPALRRMQGLAPHPPVRWATLDTDVARRGDRDEAVRVSLRDDEDGLHATPTGAQPSHRLRSMLGADGLVVVTRGQGTLAAGARVAVQPI